MKVRVVGGKFAGVIELDAQRASELPDVLHCRGTAGYEVRRGRKYVRILTQEYSLQRPVASMPEYKHP